MLNWTESVAWFTTGFSTIVILALILGVFVFFAQRAQHR